MRFGIGVLSDNPSTCFPLLHRCFVVAQLVECGRSESGRALTKWNNTLAHNPITDGTHEEHVKAGQQSHKNSPAASSAKAGEHESHTGSQVGTHEQHVKAGEQSHKTAPAAADKMDKETASTHGGQGGTHEQHVKAGQQSHKNT